VEKTIECAHKAFCSTAWSGLTNKDRRQALLSIATILRNNKEELAWLDRVVMGKPILLGVKGVEMAADVFECKTLCYQIAVSFD
jgi:acyl-CoA reductase-like NAD-dependent aldehyde dehydrogenase